MELNLPKPVPLPKTVPNLPKPVLNLPKPISTLPKPVPTESKWTQVELRDVIRVYVRTGAKFFSTLNWGLNMSHFYNSSLFYYLVFEKYFCVTQNWYNFCDFLGSSNLSSYQEGCLSTPGTRSNEDPLQANLANEKNMIIVDSSRRWIDYFDSHLFLAAWLDTKELYEPLLLFFFVFQENQRKFVNLTQDQHP